MSKEPVPLHSLLNSVCVEFETSAKSLIHAVNPGVSVGNIGEIKGQLLSLFPNIEKNEVHVSRTGQILKPFGDWSDNRLDWWTSYTDLKHNRIQNYHEANLNNVLYAMSALLVLIVYLERFRDQKKSIQATKVLYLDAMPKSFITEGEELPDTEATKVS